MSLDKMNFEEDRVTIIGADFRLRDKIGVPLTALFTQGAIEAAQREMNNGKSKLLDRCVKDAATLRELLTKLEVEPHTSADTFYEIRQITLRIKCSAGMADYPLASTIADLLFKYLEKISGVNRISLHVITAHVNAVNAVFAEKRKGINDFIAQRVILELEEMTGRGA